MPEYNPPETFPTQDCRVTVALLEDGTETLAVVHPAAGMNKPTKILGWRKYNHEEWKDKY